MSSASLFVRLALAMTMAMVMATPGLMAGQSANGDQPHVTFVHVASPEQRLRYLAEAQIWSDPGQLTPAALLAGPPLEKGSPLEGVPSDQPIPCTFSQPGKTMGGNTLKFLCTTTTGKTIRVKYTDGSKTGNREVFSAVAASRLSWSLGFHSDPIYPVSIDCHDCPADPMSGKGTRAQRKYLAIYQPDIAALVMVAKDEQNQGWRWEELDRAIDSLPVGEARSRQREHFDALMLAGVFLQHGDRKPEQQRLACIGTLRLQAGDIRPAGDNADSPVVFFERPGDTACDSPSVAMQDMGATFGGAGRTTNGSTAKMNLSAWASQEIFHSASKTESGAVPPCRGKLTVSMAAGEGSLANPRIGEAGRLFLLKQLRRLTDDHLRALFTSARVDQMSEDHSWRDPETSTVYTGVDAWIAAFKHKVQQIENRTCAA